MYPGLSSHLLWSPPRWPLGRLSRRARVRRPTPSPISGGPEAGQRPGRPARYPPTDRNRVTAGGRLLVGRLRTAPGGSGRLPTAAWDGGGCGDVSSAVTG